MVTLPDELAAVPADADSPGRAVPCASLPASGRRRACQHPSAGAGGSGGDHGAPWYRGTARQLIPDSTRPASVARRDRVAPWPARAFVIVDNGSGHRGQAAASRLRDAQDVPV